jgi:hypothetical protein
MATLQEELRSLGYKLACKEIYGENTPAYYALKREHNYLLQKLYRLQKLHS